MTTTITRHYGPYGPRVIEVAHFLAPDIGLDLISLLHEVNERWPAPTVSDLIGVMVLAEALVLEPRGST